MRLIFAVALVIGSLTGPFLLAGPVQAQDTLADIRADLSALNAEVAVLRAELSVSGGSNVSVSGGILDRVDAIEAELQRVTAKAEQLEFRINQVVEDGTNRIGDLEFRIVELEGGDLGALGQTAPLGGGAAPAVAAPAPTPLPAGTGELAVTEEQDFRRAQEALASGDFRGSADLFAAFREAYPGSPLEAQVLLGQHPRRCFVWAWPLARWARQRPPARRWARWPTPIRPARRSLTPRPP